MTASLSLSLSAPYGTSSSRCVFVGVYPRGVSLSECDLYLIIIVILFTAILKPQSRSAIDFDRWATTPHKDTQIQTQPHTHNIRGSSELLGFA